MRPWHTQPLGAQATTAAQAHASSATAGGHGDVTSLCRQPVRHVTAVARQTALSSLGPQVVGTTTTSLLLSVSKTLARTIWKRHNKRNGQMFLDRDDQ